MIGRRVASLLAILYGIPGAAWVVVSCWFVPGVIRDACQGQSLPLLNRVFQRRIPHPVEHYLDLWRIAWQAMLLAWLFHLLVVLVISVGSEVVASFGAAAAMVVIPSYITDPGLASYFPLLFGAAALAVAMKPNEIRAPRWLARASRRRRPQAGRHPALARVQVSEVQA